LNEWRSRYAGIRTTAEAALACVASGDRVYLHPGCATPLVLLEALCRCAANLRNVEVVHLMTFGTASHVQLDMLGHLRHNAVFIGVTTTSRSRVWSHASSCRRHRRH